MYVCINLFLVEKRFFQFSDEYSSETFLTLTRIRSVD
jgi:hypothetical protein